MKVLSALAGVMLALSLVVPTAEAASCPNIYKFSYLSYNPSPLWGSNTISWTQLGGSSQQSWVVERSDDNGGSWYEVQRSTSRRFMIGYLDPSVTQLRVYSTTSTGFACSPDGAAVTYDVLVFGWASNIYP